MQQIQFRHQRAHQHDVVFGSPSHLPLQKGLAFQQQHGESHFEL